MQKNKPLTSIIILAYDLNQLMRQITALAIESVVKYTDEEDYELILIDTIPVGAEKLTFFDTFKVFLLNKREDRICIKQYLKDMENPGQYGSYNIGAKLAKGDYLCFMQNDVIVTEGWLSNMKYFLDNKLAGAVQPNQFPKTREYVKWAYNLDSSTVEATQGARDAGMIMMTRETFEKIGGWNEKIKMFFGEKDIYERLAKNGLSVVGATKAMVLHVNSATYYIRQDIELEKQTEDIDVSANELNFKTVTNEVKPT
ncbi:MAG: glycosyltransferase [Actinomycetota bacterium]